MESQCPEGDRFSPSRDDDADLWQFLEGLSEHGTDPGSYEGSNSRDTASNAGARGRTRSLPHRPKTRPSNGLSRAGTQAIDMAAVKFHRNQSAFGQGSSPIQAQLSNLLPATDTSSSISAGAMHAATYPPHATAPYLQYGGLAWGYGSPAAPVNIPARQTSSQDRALSSVRSASAPIFRGVPISLQEGGNLYGSPGRTAQQDPIYAGEADSSSSSDEEQTKAVQSGGPRRRKTEGWRAQNRRAQQAFRQRQKEKHKAAELEVEELKKQVSALEADKERLQRALEEATRSVKRSKRFALESKAIAVAVTSDDWDAPVQLTSADLQALPLQRMADLWRGLVRNMALCIPDAERRPEGRQADRLKALSGEACALMWALWDLNPTVVAAFNACDLESPSQLRRHSPGMWPKILERLQLSAQQRHALAMTRRTLLANVGVLLAEREQLLAQAQGMSWAGGNACALAADLAALVEQVQANVEAVQLCTAYYTSHAYTQVLTPVQCAAFFHQCYPFGPDLLSLMAAAAADASPSDTRLMTGGFGTTAEWRKALVHPLSQLRCTA